MGRPCDRRVAQLLEMAEGPEATDGRRVVLVPSHARERRERRFEIAGSVSAERSIVEPDAVCVVGTGPVGLALSLRLARGGQSVVLVDSGRFVDRQHRDLTGGTVRQAASVDEGRDPTLRRSGTLYQYAKSDYLMASRHLGSGGSANRWLVRGRPGGRRMLRLVEGDPADFDARPDLDLPGWAVPSDRITDRYGGAFDFFGLSARRADHPVGQSPLAVDATVLPTRAFWFAPADVVHRDRVAEAVAHPAIEVVADRHLVAIESDRGERITSITVVAPQGVPTRVIAGHYVLAMGGVENARQLLLAVEEGQLSDPNDTLGRWYADHPHGRFGFFTPSAPADLVELADWYDFQFPDRDGPPVLNGHELAPASARRLGLLRFSIELVGRPAGFRSRSMVAMTQAVDATWQRRPRHLLAAIPDLFRSPFRSARLAAAVAKDRVHGPHLGGWSQPSDRLHAVETLAVDAMFEQRPSPDNRVRLGSRRDRFGRRLPSLHWSWSAKEIASINRSADLVADAFAATGRGDFVTMGQLGQGVVPRAGSGWHHLGGTRQCPEPEGGVVDGDNRVNGVANLTVVGSSIFPNTVGYANPTLVAVADALRVADRLLGHATADSHPVRD